jgi:phosphohistidine swiveling domain-containing protein
MVRKGMVFSILTFFLLIPMVYLLIFFPMLDTASRKTNLGRIIFDQMNFFQKNVDYDMGKILFIASKRSMVSLTNNVIISGVPVHNSTEILMELMSHGTYYGEEEPLMEENNLDYWGTKMAEDAQLIGFNMFLGDMEVYVEQIDYSNMLFMVGASVNISDTLGEHNLVRISNHSIGISIYGFEDSLYPLNTLGRIKRIFYLCNQTPVAYRLANGSFSSGSASGETVVRLSSQSFANITGRSSKILVTDNASLAPSNDFKGVIAEVNDTTGVTVPYIAGAENATETMFDGQDIYMDQQTKAAWDLSGLENMIQSKCYYPFDEGPSFLARAEGNFGSSTNNLQSFVDLVELSSNGLILKSGETVVDYKYFSSSSHPGKQVRGIEELWFRLDDEDGQRYGVYDLLQ